MANVGEKIASFFRKQVHWLLPLAFIVLLQVGMQFPEWVENEYSVGFYPFISRFQRFITGWLPFSVGDLIYLALILFSFGQILLIFRLWVQQKLTGLILKQKLGKAIRGLLWVYIVFYALWGMNYYRKGIVQQLQITRQEYCKEEVEVLTHQLIDSLNACRRQLKDTVLPAPSLPDIFQKAEQAYRQASKQWPFLHYTAHSIKGSMWSFLGDYIGFTGYYNPFSGEAQVRTDIPRVLTAFIACHEIGHQLGYASETEANIAGYLAAASGDVYFRYSLYNDLFSYAQSEEIKQALIIDKDTAALGAMFRYNKSHLDSLVRKDRKEIRAFFRKRDNTMAPAMSMLYDQYLKLNQQAEGIESYNEVIGWLLAYRKNMANYK
ncbi:MAG: DUF3810 domain-containing protein [Bacteroidota bacterium]|nr:DUF3810 domain-containing protein [Bacteroidota bacterium]